MLSFRTITSGAASPRDWVWILHGFLGSGENWHGFATRLVARRPALGCVLVDLRLHGGSREVQPPHTMRAVADDLRQLATAQGNPKAVVGHSFGGRSALAFAATRPQGLAQLFVLDAAPSTELERAQTQTGRVLDTLAALPPSFETHRAFVETLEARGASKAIAMWLAKNLERGPDGLRLALALDALRALLADHDRSDFWSLVEAPPPSLALHFVLAGRLSAVTCKARERLAALAKRGTVEVHELAGAGHWLHVDDPQGLLDLLARELLPASGD